MRRALLHPDAGVILIAVAALAALQLAAALTAPPLVPAADAPTRAGARVAVQGIVLSVTHGQRGRAVTLAQDGARLLALAADAPGPERGDLVRVVGVSDGEKLSADSIAVIAAAATRPLDPSDLARAPADYDGARVLVRGEVKAGPALAGGGARVALGGAPPPAASGQWLATGTFRYHANATAYELAVESWTRPS